jgi:hypothetical protein
MGEKLLHVADLLRPGCWVEWLLPTTEKGPYPARFHWSLPARSSLYLSVILFMSGFRRCRYLDAQTAVRTTTTVESRYLCPVGASIFFPGGPDWLNHCDGRESPFNFSLQFYGPMLQGICQCIFISTPPSYIIHHMGDDKSSSLFLRLRIDRAASESG